MLIMKTFLTLQVFWLLVHIHTIRGAVKWMLDTNPIVYGNNVTITCIVQERTCPENYVRRWFGGPHQTLLCLNYRSNNLTKYNMFAIKNSESFGMIIYNFDESDVECNYTCSCGFDQFTKKLSFRENKLIYPMYRWITKQTTSYNNQILSLNFSIEKVYPMPKCRLKLNDLVIVANMKFMKDNTDNWLLAKVTYSETLNTNQSLCTSEMQVECWNDLSENFSVIIQTILHNVGCYEPSFEGNDILLPVTLSLIIVAVAFTTVSLIICKKKCRIKQHNKSKKDGDKHETYRMIYQQKVDGNTCLNKA